MKETIIINLKKVDHSNWRDVYKLNVSEYQKQFVAAPGYYLCLCQYGSIWNPLAIYKNDQVIGFLMWAVDSDDNSCWLGGIIIDVTEQRKGYGREAISKAIQILSEQEELSGFALSYSPENHAKRLYESMGFKETGEQEDDELVARLYL